MEDRTLTGDTVGPRLSDSIGIIWYRQLYDIAMLWIIKNFIKQDTGVDLEFKL